MVYMIYMIYMIYGSAVKSRGNAHHTTIYPYVTPEDTEHPMRHTFANVSERRHREPYDFFAAGICFRKKEEIYHILLMVQSMRKRISQKCVQPQFAVERVMDSKIFD